MKNILVVGGLLIVGGLGVGLGAVYVRNSQADEPKYKLVCPEGTVLLQGWSAGNGYCATGSYPTRVQVN